MATECLELTEHKKFLRAARDDFAKRAVKALQEAREHKRNGRFLEALKADSRARGYRASRDRFAGQLRAASFPVNASDIRIQERDRDLAEIAFERGLHLDDDADVILDIYAERTTNAAA